MKIMIAEPFKDLAEDECGPPAGVVTSAGQALACSTPYKHDFVVAGAAAAEAHP